MRTIYRDIVAAMVFSKDGKLLMGQKDPKGGGVYPDTWHIPGGGVEQGESQLDALKREVMEEVGINVSGYKVTLIDGEGTGESEKTIDSEKVLCKMKFFVYRVDIHDKNADEINLNLSDDLMKCDWVAQKDYPKYPQTPPGVALFKKLGYI